VDGALKLSDAAALAIHAVAGVARHGAEAPITAHQLATLLSASEAHLGKILHRLARARIVTSKRGPKGGFLLGPRAAITTLLDVCELFDGPSGRSGCLLGLTACPFGACALGNGIAQANEQLRTMLASTRIADLARDPLARQAKRRKR
jgi:Rrf2 family protein